MKRGEGLRRKSRLQAGTGLSRGAQLPRRTPLRAVPKTEVKAAPKRKTARDTGPSRAVRKVVMERDGYACAGCGKAVTGAEFSLQHRVARGLGGTSRPDVNSPVNLVTLCGSATSPGCHRRAEDRDPVMHERGLWLNSWEDPAAVPVAVATASGLALRWLDASGGWASEPPEVAA